MDALHTKAEQQLERLFPNMEVPAPDGNEEEPSSDADDDYEEADPPGQTQTQRTMQERAEHARAAGMALEHGARPSRAAAAAANAAMDAMHQRGELI